jgi:hypothetical protein
LKPITTARILVTMNGTRAGAGNIILFVVTSKQHSTGFVAVIWSKARRC